MSNSTLTASSTRGRQRRVSSQRLTRADDVTGFLQVADTHDTLLFFTDHGRVYSSRVFELPPDQSRQSRGTLVHNLGIQHRTRRDSATDDGSE